MTIAVDFDGTIVEHKYPEIGREKTFAFSTLKELKKQGHILILWTVRAGRELEDAVKYCQEKGLEFDAVNANIGAEVFDEKYSPKVIADIYIDDRNIGGFPGWSNIWQILNPNVSNKIEMWESEETPQKSFAERLKYLFTGKF